MVDFVVCLGGDGVIIHASMLFKRNVPPVLSFHLGSMGFLTTHSYEDHKTDLRHVIYGWQQLDSCALDSADVAPGGNRYGVMVTLRMRLACSIVRRGSELPEQTYEVRLGHGGGLRVWVGGGGRMLAGTRMPLQVQKIR